MNSPESESTLRAAIAGVLLGTAVGDALGLPAEGLSRQRIARCWGGQWKHRFLLQRGMISDDTEHTLFVAQALLCHPQDPVAFQRCLAWKFRFWLLGIPAGIGFATLRAILKLWVGIPPTRSGVFSAGNGPAMRSALLGVYFARDPIRRRDFVAACTQVTHTDPRAETAALAIAEAVSWTVNPVGPLEHFHSRLLELGQDEEWQALCRQLFKSLAEGRTVAEFSESLGLNVGVTGYAYHTVPVALFAWMRHPDDFSDALTSVLNCGGDTDTVGSIVGGLMGARVGIRGIPVDLIQGLCEWPRSASWMERLSNRLAAQESSPKPLGPVGYFWPGILPRNVLFLLMVLAHGFRRLLPPY